MKFRPHTVLQSALMLTEVLKEREAQIELKRLREASVCGDNQETRAKLREAYEESLRIDREEKQKARDAKIKTVEYQKAQYDTLCVHVSTAHGITLLVPSAKLLYVEPG